MQDRSNIVINLMIPLNQFNHQKRKLYEQLLREVPILESLNETELTNLADALLSREFKEGETIMKQGKQMPSLSRAGNGKENRLHRRLPIY